MHDVDDLNAGYAKALLEEYLENPEAVPEEWRRLFESGDSEIVTTHPGLARLLETLREDGNGHHAAPVVSPVAPAPVAPPQPVRLDPDPELLAAVAAASRLVGAYRRHGHLAARLDPLGTEPVGDPSLEPEQAEPPLTRELQARIPASALRLYVPGETLADALPAARRDLLRHDRVRGRAHLRSRGAPLAAPRGRVRPLPAAAERGREAAAARAAVAHRGLRDLSAPRLPGAEAVLRRGPRRDDAHAGRDGRARCRRRRSRGRDRDGAPWAAERPRAHGRPAVRGDPARVRGRADDPRGRRHPGRRHGGRQVPPRRRGHAQDRGGRDRGHTRLQPEPPRGRRPGRGGLDAGGADRPLGRRGRPRPLRRAPRPHPRRRVFRGPGRGRGDVQLRGPAGLLDGRDAAPDREQPGRLHDRSRRGPVDALLVRPGQGLRRADRPRQCRRPRGGDRGRPARSGVPAAVRPRRRRRSGRLPPLRPQRAGRAGLHTAAAGRDDRRAADRARAVRGPSRRGGRGHRRGGAGDGRPAARASCARRTSG